MCPGWWAGRGCLLGVLLLLAGGAPAPAALSTTPGAPGASPYPSHHPPRHRHHLEGEASWVPRARRPPPPANEAAPPTLDRQVLPPLVAGPTDPPGITAPDPSMMARQPRSTPSNITRNFSHHHKLRHQLYSENSNSFLKLATDGTVSFIENNTDPHTLLHVKPMPDGVLELQSQATGLYLCMNKHGFLYASCNRTAECEFVRKLEDTYYDTLRSHPYSRRYLAISTSGRIKRAREVKEHLGKEHFFLFPPLPRKRTNSIIKKYQKQLGRPLQRCAGYNEYSVAVAGDPRDAGQRVTDVTTTTTTTTTTSTTTTTTTTALPTTTVTTAPRSPSSARRCRKVNGKMRCRRCRTVKGKRKCRKSPKRCKNKKCKRKRKKQKRRKKDEEKRETRMRKRGERRRKAGTSSSPQAGDRGRRKKVEGKSEAAAGRGSHSRRTSQRRRPSGGGGSRRLRHQRRRNKTARSSITTTTTTTTTPKPPSQRRGSKTASGSSKAGLVPLTRPPRRPFPPAPSSARPYRVRHGHNAGRGRRPRGRRRPLTSTDA